VTADLATGADPLKRLSISKRRTPHRSARGAPRGARHLVTDTSLRALSRRRPRYRGALVKMAFIVQSQWARREVPGRAAGPRDGRALVAAALATAQTAEAD